MNIGIVTVWFERGAAYVSAIYKEILENNGHNVYIYARGGERNQESINTVFDDRNVTRDKMYISTRINVFLFDKWVQKNRLDTIFFNEQQDFRIITHIKKKFPNIKLGSYIDYYTEKTIKWFDLYDFLICNTQRHIEAMEFHPQKFYVKWGTNINVFRPKRNKNDKIVFFHSVGMSNRKGTDILVNAFIDGKLYTKSKLLIHTQIPIENVCKFNKEELKKYSIEVVEKTISAPGLYEKGDVYVYPTKLDGLGLTIYEALASGLPVITTNFPPMNEIINNDIGKLVKVKRHYCRNDGYFWPMAVCEENDLIKKMSWYIDNKTILTKLKKDARKYAENNLNIYDRSSDIVNIFVNSKRRKPINFKLLKEIEMYYIVNVNLLKSIFDLRAINDLLKKMNRK